MAVVFPKLADAGVKLDALKEDPSTAGRPPLTVTNASPVVQSCVIDVFIAGKLNEDADVTAPVQSYWANKYGIYNLSGNVAEMIADKGRAVGGSWDDPAASVTTESEVTFDKPRPTIGFRVFMEIIEN